MSNQFICHVCGVMIPTTIYASHEMNTPFKTYIVIFICLDIMNLDIMLKIMRQN